MYDTFDDSYQGIQAKFLNCDLRWFKKGDFVPLYEGYLPKDCIIVTSYYGGKMFLLFKNNKYINYFYNLQDIKGTFPIFEDGFGLTKSSNSNWTLLDYNYIKRKRAEKNKKRRKEVLNVSIFNILKDKGYFDEE